jgi:hypothetical protein
MAKPIPVADKVIALASLTEILKVECAAIGAHPDHPAILAAGMVNQAAKVRFQPSTRQLVVTYDLAFGEQDPGDTDG